MNVLIEIFEDNSGNNYEFDLNFGDSRVVDFGKRIMLYIFNFTSNYVKMLKKSSRPPGRARINVLEGFKPAPVDDEIRILEFLKRSRYLSSIEYELNNIIQTTNIQNSKTTTDWISDRFDLILEKCPTVRDFVQKACKLYFQTIPKTFNLESENCLVVHPFDYHIDRYFSVLAKYKLLFTSKEELEHISEFNSKYFTDLQTISKILTSFGFSVLNSDLQLQLNSELPNSLIYAMSLSHGLHTEGFSTYSGEIVGLNGGGIHTILPNRQINQDEYLFLPKDGRYDYYYLSNPDDSQNKTLVKSAGYSLAVSRFLRQQLELTHGYTQAIVFATHFINNYYRAGIPCMINYL